MKKKPLPKEMPRSKKVQPKQSPEEPVAKRPRGRPRLRPGPEPLLNEETASQICEFIRMGSSVDTAAAAVGIGLKTYRKWLREANRAKKKPSDIRDDRDELYIAFLNAVHQATAEHDTHYLGLIHDAAKWDWRAGAWVLTHGINKHKWVNPKKTEVNVSGGTTNTTNVTIGKNPWDEVPLDLTRRFIEWSENKDKQPSLIINAKEVPTSDVK